MDTPEANARSTNDAAFGRGISRRLARYRAGRIFELRYRLDCRITARGRALHGKQEIRFRLERPLGTQGLMLDWRPQLSVARIERMVRSVTINGHASTGTAFRAGRLWIPTDAVHRGENRIALEWLAPVRDAAWALTRYRDPADGAIYVYSLFVPADASTIFPCFDQPDLKARFKLSLTVPRVWHAIANAPIAEIENASRARRIAFDATEPISTYAFAFAAGPFAALRSSDKRETTRLWVRRSQSRRGKRHAAEVLRLNSEAVRYCARYFACRFPFGKYDLVLVPQFPYRGMEHAGATFLNEDAALPAGSAGKAAHFQRAQLIFHETAHQWMGDLVTMRWFDDLWIKEGFANFIAYKLAERACSAQYARLAFHDLKAGAYEVDVTSGATALHHPVADLTHAKSAYNTIVYAKAPAVLRMLEHALGEQTFRQGMRALVRRHAYATIDWRSLIATLEQASGRSLMHWARAWLLRMRTKKTRALHAGMPAHEYALIEPGRAGATQALRSLARATDPLRRKHLWEYLWWAVRARSLHPVRFVEAALAHSAADENDLTIARLTARLRVVIDRLLDVSEQRQIVPQLESFAWKAARSAKGADTRLAWTRALIGLSRTERACGRLFPLLERRRRLAFVDRLAIAGALVAAGYLNPRTAIERLVPDERSKERRLAAHCLHAANPTASGKRKVFRRWLLDASIPEYWIEAALPYLNHPTHAKLTLPLLREALEALPSLAETRKIFFVNRWLATFIGGQSGSHAVDIIRAFLGKAVLAADLRLKVLEFTDPLEQDVALHAQWHRNAAQRVRR